MSSRSDAADAATVHVVTGTANGVPFTDAVAPGLLLVDFVRERLGLKGTHIGCLTGDCGACTLVLDGRIVKSCTVLAATLDGSAIETVEGLARDGELHPVQRAFWEQHGFQCGFCLPGMLFAAIDLLSVRPDPSEAEIRRALSGNLCRCTGYQAQVTAVATAARALRDAPA